LKYLTTLVQRQVIGITGPTSHNQDKTNIFM